METMPLIIKSSMIPTLLQQNLTFNFRKLEKAKHLRLLSLLAAVEDDIVFATFASSFFRFPVWFLFPEFLDRTFFLISSLTLCLSMISAQPSLHSGPWSFFQGQTFPWFLMSTFGFPWFRHLAHVGCLVFPFSIFQDASSTSRAGREVSTNSVAPYGLQLDAGMACRWDWQIVPPISNITGPWGSRQLRKNAAKLATGEVYLNVVIVLWSTLTKNKMKTIPKTIF